MEKEPYLWASSAIWHAAKVTVSRGTGGQCAWAPGTGPPMSKKLSAQVTCCPFSTNKDFFFNFAQRSEFTPVFRWHLFCRMLHFKHTLYYSIFCCYSLILQSGFSSKCHNVPISVLLSSQFYLVSTFKQPKWTKVMHKLKQYCNCNHGKTSQL